jgi:hypothetical protein
MRFRSARRQRAPMLPPGNFGLREMGLAELRKKHSCVQNVRTPVDDSGASEKIRLASLPDRPASQPDFSGCDSIGRGAKNNDAGLTTPGANNHKT